MVFYRYWSIAIYICIVIYIYVYIYIYILLYSCHQYSIHLIFILFNVFLIWRVLFLLLHICILCIYIYRQILIMHSVCVFGRDNFLMGLFRKIIIKKNSVSPMRIWQSWFVGYPWVLELKIPKLKIITLTDTTFGWIVE